MAWLSASFSAGSLAALGEALVFVTVAATVALHVDYHTSLSHNPSKQVLFLHPFHR